MLTVQVIVVQLIVWKLPAQSQLPQYPLASFLIRNLDVQLSAKQQRSIEISARPIQQCGHILSDHALMLHDVIYNYCYRPIEIKLLWV
jgi:hypothetical protein